MPPPGYGGAGAAAAPGPLTVTVPIGLDAAPDFGLAGRLRGPGAHTLALRRARPHVGQPGVVRAIRDPAPPPLPSALPEVGMAAQRVF